MDLSTPHHTVQSNYNINLPICLYVIILFPFFHHQSDLNDTYQQWNPEILNLYILSGWTSCSSEVSDIDLLMWSLGETVGPESSRKEGDFVWGDHHVDVAWTTGND